MTQPGPNTKIVTNVETGETQIVELTPEEIAEREATAATEQAQQAAQQATTQEFVLAKGELTSEYQAAMDRLNQIIDAQSPTNAQVVTAVRDMATMLRRTLRLLRAMFETA